MIAFRWSVCLAVFVAVAAAAQAREGAFEGMVEGSENPSHSVKPMPELTGTADREAPSLETRAGSTAVVASSPTRPALNPGWWQLTQIIQEWRNGVEKGAADVEKSKGCLTSAEAQEMIESLERFGNTLMEILSTSKTESLQEETGLVGHTCQKIGPVFEGAGVSKEVSCTSPSSLANPSSLKFTMKTQYETDGLRFNMVVTRIEKDGSILKTAVSTIGRRMGECPTEAPVKTGQKKSERRSLP